jgi:hypothetical protein
MPDYGYQNSLWNFAQNLRAPNAGMVQRGMQMMQPMPYTPGGTAPQMQTLPYVFGSGSPQGGTKTLPYASDDKPQDEQPAASGKRRIRIGNKTYIEE